jgi:hypothetical protein
MPQGELYPYQRAVLSGPMALLYNQILTGRSIAQEVLLEGRAGTGKSIGALTYLVQACYTWPGIRVLLTRDTRASMTESTLVTLEEEVLGVEHPAVLNGPTRGHREQYELGASCIVPLGQDSPDRLFSTAWDIIYANEAHEISLEAWELFGRAQRPRMRQAMPYRQRIADVNPTHPGHWLNQRSTPAGNELRAVRTIADYARLQAYNAGPQEGAMRRLISVHQDNPRYWDWEAWGWTDAGLEMLAGLKSMSGSRRQRMLEGLWVAASGSVYPEFNESLHTVNPFTVPRDWPVYVFYDPGYDHPCAVLWVAVTPTEKLLVVDEVYGGGITIPDLAKMIKQRNKGYNVLGYYGDPQKIDAETQEANGVSIRAQMKGLGLNFSLWPRTGRDIDNQVEAVRKRLIDRTVEIFKPCRWLISEFQSWRYKRNAKGEMLSGDDQFEDKNNNALDCIRGAVAQGLHYEPSRVTLIPNAPQRVKLIPRR